MKEYKVVTQSNQLISARFDASKLERTVNAYASEGWILKGFATAPIPGREEIVFIFERDKAT